jgi:Uma2 family endonuclease
MVAPITTCPEEPLTLAELLRPDLSVNGAEPEQRIVLTEISWERYLEIDRALGRDAAGRHLYYLDGKLEIMSTSEEHERLKKWLAGFLEIYFEENELEIVTRGEATVRLRDAGAEPDDSWCIGRSKKFPDLALEIALSSGGINKLEIYARLKIPEVWLWRKSALEIFAFERSGYQQVRRSRLLPNLDVSLLTKCVSMKSWQQARKAFRAGLSAKHR